MSNAAEDKAGLRVEDAVRAAIRALPSFLGGQTHGGVRVEEVFRPRGDNFWRITLSHLEPGIAKPAPPLFNAFDLAPLKAPPPPERVYHVLEVDAVTGEVVSMRLREEPG